tara:strand:+ start:273 stop:497 length:225 start_codon:yes stop_codon:yes gene_type:complete
MIGMACLIEVVNKYLRFVFFEIYNEITTPIKRANIGELKKLNFELINGLNDINKIGTQIGELANLKLKKLSDCD